MKSFLEISPDQKKRMIRWALLNDRADMWNDKGAFCSQRAAQDLFHVGLQSEEKKLS